MLELLKKIGVPATVAAVIASLVTTIPLIFKIDERYAKTGELEEVSTRAAKQVQDLTVEVSKLAGVQQTMLTLVVQAEQRAQQPMQPSTVMVPVPQTTVVQRPVAVAAAVAPSQTPEECARLEAAGFRCMGAPVRMRAAPAPALGASAPQTTTTTTQTVQVPVKITPPAKSAAEQAEEAARLKRFSEIQSELARSQDKIQSIQRY